MLLLLLLLLLLSVFCTLFVSWELFFRFVRTTLFANWRAVVAWEELFAIIKDFLSLAAADLVNGLLPTSRMPVAVICLFCSETDPTVG